MDETQFELAFARCPGIGPVRFRDLIAAFKTAEVAYHASEEALTDVLGSSSTSLFLRFRHRYDPHEELSMIARRGITVWGMSHQFYPRILAEIPDPPICLYVKGNTEINWGALTCLAVVGTRRATSYGVQVTKTIVSELSRAKITIVSGMAMGIDTIAHAATLDAGGHTVAVLGSPVDMPTPSQNTALYQRILKHGGTILSETPPETSVQKGMFIARNRIVAGLSRGALIVEGTNHSGSLTTARFAALQGRDVFAVPGPITSELSQAPHILIKEGGKIVTSAADILDEYRIPAAHLPRFPVGELTDAETHIYELIRREPSSSDDIARSLGIAVSEILQLIAVMEVKGCIAYINGKYEIS